MVLIFIICTSVVGNVYKYKSQSSIEEVSLDLDLTRVSKYASKARSIRGLCLRTPSCKTIATAAYYEARGESDEGVLLVMQTILNRVKHNRWANSVRGVVYEPKQFSFTWDGSLDKAENNQKQWMRMYKLAYMLLNGDVQIPKEWHTVTHYHTKSVNPKWNKHYVKVAVVGNHIAYECKRRC